MNYTPPAPLPQGMIPLVPIDAKSLTPPKRRIKSASEAQTIVANLWQANLQRNVHNAAMQGQIDGNPPYSPSRLRQMGRASDPNFNTLEAKAIRSAALVPYFDLFAGGNRYVEVRLAPPGQGNDASGYGTARYNGVGDSPDPNYDPIRLSEDSGIVSEEYDRLLRRWTNFEHVMYMALTDYVTFGRCHLPWECYDSWRFKRVAYHRVLVPDNTPIDNEEQEVVLLLQNYTVARLYGMIRDESAAESAGWNINATMNAILAAVTVDPAIPEDPMAIQQMVRDSDIYVSARNATVQTATIFVREFSGKWSELVVRRDQIPGTVGGAQNDPVKPEFLFEAYERYDTLEDALTSMFFEVSDGTWNSSAGLARDIFSLMQLKDRLACTQAQSVMLRNSLVLQPRTALDRSRMNLVQFGAITWLPENVEVHQSTILGDIASTIEVSREFSAMIERNTGIYRPTMEKQAGNPDTLGEFQAKFAQATMLSTSAINRFYSQLDRLYAVQWPRVLKLGLKKTGSTIYEKEAQEFVRRCEARGVSRDALKRLDSIRAFRNIGQGSQAMRQQTLQNFMGLYPLLPANGQENLLEDVIRTAGSQHQVERYLPDADRRKLPSDQMAYALLENAAMRANAPVSWTPSQNNIIHAQAHLQAGAQAAQSTQLGASPHDVVSFIDAIGAHTTIHLQREAANPTSKEAVKVLTAQLKQLGAINDKIKQAIMALPKQQETLAQKRADVLTDADVKRLDVQLKNQTSREKAIATLQLKKQRQDAELAMKAQKQQVDTALAAQALQVDAATAQQSAALDAALADAETAAELQRQTAKTTTEIDSTRRKTDAAIEAQRAKAAAAPSTDD